MCSEYGITHLQSSSYHHQTNGKVERFHKFLENSLAAVVKKDQSNWPELIEPCLFVYRTTFNRTLNDTPYFVMFGRDAVMPQDLMIPHYNRGLRQISNTDLQGYKIELLRTLRLIHERLQEHKDKYQSSYKKYHDKVRRVIEFEPGDLVYIHIGNPENANLSFKISHRWRGPIQS